VFGVALAVSVAGCGGTEAPVASSPSSPPPDPKVAFAQYEKAVKPFDCTDAYGNIGDAHDDGDLVAMQDNARKLRDVVTTLNAELSEITFPAAAQSIVDRMRELTADEVAGLNELAEIDVNNAERIAVVRSEIEATDTAVTVESDRLRAALGHPESVFGSAADLLALADNTAYRDLVPQSYKFEAAIAANDLAGAKAANATEIEALQRFIDEIAAIDWPPGSFEAQANTLREQLRGQIEFDRRQTDVATAADIVRAPDAGTPEWLAARAAYDALWKALVQADQTARPASMC
jgi:hypothetical protein